MSRVWQAGVSPQNRHFPPSFTPRFGYFPKKLRKTALDTIRVLFKDEPITIDIVPHLKKILDFSRGATPFRKNQSSQKLELELILLRIFLLLGSKQSFK